MGFATAVRTCLSKFVTFAGRASRSEFWWFFLFVILGQLVFGILDSMLGLTGSDAPEGADVQGFRNQSPLAALFGLAMLLPLLAVGARRLHDRDMSAWWLLLHFVPVLGSLALLVLYALRGTDGENRFGPEPRPDS